MGLFEPGSMTGRLPLEDVPNATIFSPPENEHGKETTKSHKVHRRALNHGLMYLVLEWLHKMKEAAEKLKLRLGAAVTRSRGARDRD